MAVAPDAPQRYIGLMSGTSLDGVDGVLVDLAAAPRVLAHSHLAFAPALRDELAALREPGSDEIERCGRAAMALAERYAECVQQLLASAACSPEQVRAIGAHGQTVRHRPQSGFSLQLNAPARLAELTGIDVVADFRSRDIAAGGEGAPLAPAFHAAVFAAPHARAVVNIGGIGNVTALVPGAPPLGFDCGPGNALLDLNAQRHRGTPLDADGAFARTGRVDADLLQRLMADPYFSAPPPKSTGRELFSAAWLDRALGAAAPAPADVQRTLTELTARAIAESIARWAPGVTEVIVCGGGVRNAVLMESLAQALAPRRVTASDAHGVPHDQVEALAFAWLAQRHCQRAPASLPSVTGARGPRVLGALYPR